MRRISENVPHLAWRGEPPGFSRVAVGALDLRRGPQGPALVASGKASPLGSCSGASRGSLGIPLQSISGPKTLCGVGARPEVSSPVLTWILGYFWSLPSGVSPRLEWGHARALSSRAVAAVSRFPSRESKQLWHSLRLSHEAFSRGFPTRLSHRAVPRATVV